MSSKLVLIDGHSLAFRAYHALPPDMATRAGEPTNATFGFFSMLLNVLRDVKPEYVAVAFDVGETFRHRDYADYKGHRERMPDDLRQQIERIQDVVRVFNIPIFTARALRPTTCSAPWRARAMNKALTRSSSPATGTSCSVSPRRRPSSRADASSATPSSTPRNRSRRSTAWRPSSSLT